MTTLLVMLTIHFVADFLLQSDWMAQGKSKAWRPLLTHTAIYSACFLWFGLPFALVTFATHTAQDYITSRINARLWGAKQVHWFFVGIGFDQLLHAYTLALTYFWLVQS